MNKVYAFEDVLKEKHREVTSSKIKITKNIYHPKGVYSEQIFGPIKDYVCQCGELFGKAHEGKRCKKCGVICGPSILRYKEFGYIKLKLPVLNPILLDIFIKKYFKTQANFKEIYEKTVLEDKFYLFNKNTKKFEILPEFNHSEFINAPTSNEKLNEIVYKLLDKLEKHKKITPERKKYILNNYVCSQPVFGLYSLYKFFESKFGKKIIEEHFEKYPSYKVFKNLLFLNFIPVIPPEIRPIVHLTSGDVIEHEISKKYRSLIRLNYENELLEEIVKEEKNTLQNVYQKDFWTFRLSKNISELYEKLIDSISGKEGKIRSFILGKTIDFSGRAVIVPSLKIKPYEILIPYHMAKEVSSVHFVSFVQKHANKDLAIKFLHIHNNLLSKEALSKDELKELDKLFEKFIDCVNSKKIKIIAFANRQPSIWPYSMNIFDVVINKDKDAHVIGIHPIVVEPFNADFDGDSIDGKVELLVKNKKITAYMNELEHLKI